LVFFPIFGTVSLEAGPVEEEKPAFLMDSSAVVKAAVAPGSFSAQPGDTLRFQVTLEVDPRWHLYAHEDTLFYGIDLQLPEEPPLEAIAVTYPTGQPAKFFGEKVQVLHGRQVIQVRGVVKDGPGAGKHLLKLQMAVQACDLTRCLAPAFLPLEVELNLKR
jgi:hypothetical protein